VLPPVVKLLTDRELAVFALIAAEQSVGRIAKKLGISRTTVETHCQHIKLKLGYANAEALKRGARELLGTTRRPQNSPSRCSRLAPCHAEALRRRVSRRSQAQIPDTPIADNPR